MRRPLLLVASLPLIVFACRATQGPAAPLDVFAAASLRNVALDLAADFERQVEVSVIFNFAASSTLAQQIVAAPRADVFLSADERWVDFIESDPRRLVERRRPFLGNRMVVVAHRDARLEPPPRHDPGTLFQSRFRFLAVADPSGVPAGRYAKAHLEQLIAPGGESWWEVLAERRVPTLDVRAALALVESDPEILGIVYRTDALTSGRVRVLHEFEPLVDRPIVYWAASLTEGDAPAAAAEFVDYLIGPAAREIARRHGFGPAAG